ncbi:hypothetical protein OU548_26340, partial [Escherichia coli]|nr:hypothetical protein [Escherichia coli]
MKKLLICWGVFLGHIWDRNRPQIDTEIELRMLFKKCNYLKKPREGANKRGNSSRLTQSFHFFMFEPI